MSAAKISDGDWLELIRTGSDEGWKLIWVRVVEPEAKSQRSATMMRRYSLTAGDLMGMLYADMIGRGKIGLFRNDGGSLQGWLRTYVRGYVLNADPNRHGEISIEGAHPDSDGEREGLVLPQEDGRVLRSEAWRLTHYCFRELWNEDPERAYVHLLKTRFVLSSEEIRDFLDVSSAANVDQIFSRSVKFMRTAWMRHDTISGVGM